jgi:hypothetical protein
MYLLLHCGNMPTKQLRHMHIGIDANLRAGLEAVQVRDGVSYTEQIRTALRLWFDTNGLGRKPRRRVR